MTNTDRARFAEAIHALGETFNEPVSTIRVEGYFDALSDLELWQVEAAVRLALRSCTFFPRPVELRALVTGTTEERADTAWGEVMKQIQAVGYMGRPKFSDQATFTAIDALWGGWRHLCETLPGEGPELVGWIKQFKATFQTCSRREERHQLTGFSSASQLAHALRSRLLPEPEADV